MDGRVCKGKARNQEASCVPDRKDDKKLMLGGRYVAPNGTRSAYLMLAACVVT